VTGREAIVKVAGNERIADELRKEGFVCVPIQPTRDMLEAAWADALAENARGVWDSMIEACDGINAMENPTLGV
jgi:hypothetical protein